MSWGRVFVEGLELSASIGVLEHEHRARQPLFVDITLEINIGFPVEGDLSSVIDYRVPVDHAKRLVEAGHIELIETFAENLAAACLADHRVLTATVRAWKPYAIADAKASGVEITRQR